MSPSSSNNVAKSLNPRTTSYEFLGPPGAFIITLGVPAVTYALYFGCSDFSGGCPPPLSTLSSDRILKSLSNIDTWKNLWDTQATLIYFAWYAFCVLAWFVLPAHWVEGVKLRTGDRIKYKINGTFQVPYMLRATKTANQPSLPSSLHWACCQAISSASAQSPSPSSTTNWSASSQPQPSWP